MNYQKRIKDFYFGDAKLHHKALIVGFVDYPKPPEFFVGDVCQKSAQQINDALLPHWQTTLVDCTYMEREGKGMKRSEAMEKEIKRLLNNSTKEDSLFFYYSMHGIAVDKELVLDVDKDDEYHISELLKLASDSEYKSLVLVLDCCHSGDIGDRSGGIFYNMPRGMCIITAGMPHTNVIVGGRKMLFQVPNANIWDIQREIPSGTVIDQNDIDKSKSLPYFSNYFIEALQGGAANPLGIVNIELAYQYASEAMGTNNNSSIQFVDNRYDKDHGRPMMKSNLDCEVPLTFVEGQLNDTDIELLNRFVDKVHTSKSENIKFPDFVDYPFTLLKMKLYSFIRTSNKKDEGIEQIHNKEIEYYLRPRGWHYWQVLNDLNHIASESNQ